MENSEKQEIVETNETTVQDSTQPESVYEETERSIEKALECKNQGNELFKQGEYEKVARLINICSKLAKAIDIYKEGLRYCPKDDPKTASILYSNCSSCYYNLAVYDMCIECATQSIELNKEYVRPVLSRANANYELEKYEEAYEEDFQTVEKLDASAVQKPDIQRKMAVVKKKMDEINEQRKTEVMKNLKDLGNTLLGKFGLSLDNFKVQQNETGAYNIAFQK